MNVATGSRARTPTQRAGERSVTAKIRKIRKPDPYQGKGVRSQGEVVKRKVGKTGK